MDWYYARDGRQGGPIDETELQAMAQDGRLLPSDLVWNESMGDQWAPAANQPFLFPAGDGNPLSPFPRGNTHNRELMRQARECLTGVWGTAISVMVVYQSIAIALAFIPDLLTGTEFAGSIASLLVMPTLNVGLLTVFLSIARRKEAVIGDLFSRMRSAGTAIGAALLMTVLILAWMCLLIVPGIIMSYAYSMTFFVIADDPAIGPMEAISRSKTLMQGHKWKLFCLFCRFIGWSFVGLLTLGIAFIWIAPYMQVAMARFYDDLLAP
jgi:uncharacterized membrane protein